MRWLKGDEEVTIVMAILFIVAALIVDASYILSRPNSGEIGMERHSAPRHVPNTDDRSRLWG